MDCNYSPLPNEACTSAARGRLSESAATTGRCWSQRWTYWESINMRTQRRRLRLELPLPTDSSICRWGWTRRSTLNYSGQGQPVRPTKKERKKKHSIWPVNCAGRASTANCTWLASFSESVRSYHRVRSIQPPSAALATEIGQLAGQI